MTRYLMLIFVACAVSATFVAGARPAAALENLLLNPSFDADANGDGVADGWFGEIHSQEGAQGSFGLDNSVRHFGAASQRLDHSSANAAWVRVSQQPIPARPGASYVWRFWARGDCQIAAIIYEFRKGGLDYLTNTLFSGPAPADWQPITATFRASADADYFKLSLIAAGKGSVWFDNAYLAQVNELPYLTVRRTASPPRVDGRLDDPAWQSAATATDFMTLNGNGQLAAAATAAMAAFDDNALYIAFRCAEPDPSRLRREAKADGPEIWSDDRVEVFITPDPAQGHIHAGVSAAGFKCFESAANDRWNASWHGSPRWQWETPAWEAAAVVGQSEWTAEMRIPLAALAAAAGRGRTWGANFCRARLAGEPAKYSTWSYVPGLQFGRPERFGSLVFAAPAMQPPQMVRRDAAWMPPLPVIIPQPVSVRWREGVFRPDRDTRIIIADEKQRVGAKMLAADLAGRFRLRAPIVMADRAAGRGCIHLGVGAAFSPNPAPAESYRLEVRPDRVVIVGADDRGAFYGVQTLRQMLQADGAGQPLVPACEIEDRPSMPWRGWHMASPAAANLDLYRDVVDLLALLKYNTIVWEVDANFQYSSHPDISSPAAPTPAQLAALVAYAKERHFEVIPQLATFAHFDYVLQHPNYKHLAESQKTTKGWQSLFNYCPSNPQTYDLVFALMDELIEVFKPRYFHIGHDEARFDDIGVCERCRATDPWVLWAQDLNKLHAYLAAKGIRTLMWGDQFLEKDNGGPSFFTARATDMVPKDIIICDWHYGAGYDYASTLGYFAQHGFQALGCPWFDLDNVYGFAGAVKQQAALGFLGTTWYGVDSSVAAVPHIAAAWVIGAENAWSTGHPPIDKITYAPIPAFNHLWRLSPRRPARRFELVDLAPYCNESLVDSDRRDGWMGEGAGCDLRALPAGVQWIGNYPFSILRHETSSDASCVMLSDQTELGKHYPAAMRAIAVGRRASALLFLHTCAIPARRNRELYDPEGVNPSAVGRYVVRYADGEEREIPLLYQATIADFDSQLGFVQAQELWRGRTHSGALATLGVLRWENPRPQVEIESLDFISAEAQVRPALLAVTLEPARDQP